MAWPPNPNPSSNNNTQSQPQLSSPSSGQEWRLLEKTLMASIDEQRKARRWGIFFKLLTFLYIVFIALMLGRCSTAPTGKVALDVTEPHLAVVDIQGMISDGTPANALDINSALKDAFENDKVKAIALNINSPGGSPVQSDEVWQTIRTLKEEYPDKKVYAVIGDMGASGAYYIASASDEIWVNSSSLVGSIGVIMSSYNTEELMKKIGVQDRTMTSGEYKDILSMSRPMTEEERVHIQATLDGIHKEFIDAVVKGRGDKLKNPEQNKLFSGLFWTGKQSVELGLADKIGGISALKKEVGVDYAVDYTPVDPMQQFFDRFGVQLGQGLGVGLGQAGIEQTTPNLR